MKHAKNANSEFDSQTMLVERDEAVAPRYLMIVRVLFVGLALLVCLVPFLGTFVAPTTESTEKRTLAAAPELTNDEGQVNVNLLQDSGMWFTDHFALRNVLVSTDSLVRAKLFHTSANSQVIIGDDGWLFYDGTLPDYQGTRETTDRTLDNVAFNLSLIQGYVQSTGAEFRFTLVPNKNTVYGQYMPSRYGTSEEEHDAIRLKSFLEQRNVNYVDLMSVMGEAAASGEDQLYYATDTHWNAKGALLGYRGLISTLSGTYDDYAGLEWASAEHMGDLESMLYPVGARAEEDAVLSPEPAYSFVEGEDVEDASLATVSNGSGRLLMFRDSFANALIPYLAPQFEEARFTKMTPYDLTAVASYKPDVVIWERAERELLDLASEPPYMYAPRTNALPTNTSDYDLATVEICHNGGLLDISGVLDESLRDGADTIFVTVYDQTEEPVGTYVAFRTTVEVDEGVSDLGYRVYLDAATVENVSRIAVSTELDGELTQLAFVDCTE